MLAWDPFANDDGDFSSCEILEFLPRLFDLGTGLLSRYVSKWFISNSVNCSSCRSTIRDKIIPHAVSWFTGEAAQDEYGDVDDDEEDIEEDDEEDEEEDEEEEEEDDEEDDEEESKTRKKVNWCRQFIDHFLMCVWHPIILSVH